MIAQLKAENFEYRQKEKDYNTLHNQLLDLEHRFRLLQDEKNLAERESRDREDVHYKNNDELHADIRTLKLALEDKQKDVKNAVTDLAAYKGLVDDKGAEISDLKKDVANCAADNAELLRAKKNAETDLAVVFDGKKAAQTEGDRVALSNERTTAAEAQTAERLTQNRLESAELQRKIERVNGLITDLGAVKRGKDADIGVTLQGKSSNQLEADRLVSINAQLQDDNRNLEISAKDSELLLAKQRQKLDDALVVLSGNEKELLVARAGLSSADGKALETGDRARKLLRENEVLQSLLDKYRGDVELQRKLRLAETSKKLELEEDKKKLEREVIHKELEAHSAKRELERVHSDHGRLLDDHQQLSQELGAIKEHAELLESQNVNVSSL